MVSQGRRKGALETNISSFSFITRPGNTLCCPWPHIHGAGWQLAHTLVHGYGEVSGRRKAKDTSHSSLAPKALRASGLLITEDITSAHAPQQLPPVPALHLPAPRLPDHVAGWILKSPEATETDSR